MNLDDVKTIVIAGRTFERNLRKMLQKHDLNTLQFLILAELAESQQTNVELSKRLTGGSSPHLTMVAAPLRHRNLVAAVPAPDRRLRVLSLTNQGTEMVHALEAELRDGVL